MPKATWNTGVYQIRNTINGKVYVGGAYSLCQRYGCAYITIYKAVKGITWGHVR